MNIEERHLIAAKIQKSLDLLDEVIREHRPTYVFGLFSGGHDSFSSSYVASLHPNFFGCAHIDTGIGIEATRQYVMDTCEARNWKLAYYKATENQQANGKYDPIIYEDIVVKNGFPGPAAHGKMYIQLKERALCRLERDFGANCRGRVKKRVLYVGGCRRQESVRRMANVDIKKIDGRRIWVNPIYDWSKLDTSLCLEYANQERNMVVDLIHKSGECLCGAFAKPGELEELNQWEITRPAYEEIKRLQKLVPAELGCVWGQRPPKKERKNCVLPGMMCHSCK